MYTISLYASHLEVNRDADDEKYLRNIPCDINIDGTYYRIREYGLTRYQEGVNECYYIGRSSYNACWEKFNRRLDVFSKVVKLFNKYNIPYRIDVPSQINITNKKGTVYAYLL